MVCNSSNIAAREEIRDKGTQRDKILNEVEREVRNSIV